MKKVLAVAVLTLAAIPAFAQHGHWERRGGGWGWVAPVIIGGAIGYELARPPVVVQQQPVYIPPAPVVVQPAPVQNCSPWTEVRNPDGTVTVTRTCTQ